MSKQPCDDYSGIENGFRDLVKAQMTLTREILNLGGNMFRSVVGGMTGMGIPSPKACCTIPEPCWMPLSLGEIRCGLRRGESGELCLIIVNEDFRPRQFTVSVAGKDAALVSLKQGAFPIGPKERVCLKATFTVPKEDRTRDQNCPCCEDLEVLIWVRGCRSHYLRWVVSVSEQCRSTCCCHEVTVHDKPDYILHWYDHFYINRPCSGPGDLSG